MSPIAFNSKALSVNVALTSLERAEEVADRVETFAFVSEVGGSL